MKNTDKSPDGSTPRTISTRRVVTASAFGSTIEYYDFFLYGTAAALVFPSVFFPTFDPVAGTILSFGTFAVGFVSRPLGALVCGHYGDRIGRKAMLMLTLLMMGLSTAAIGLLPSYDSVGIAAPLLLITMRFLQGFSFGGELGGAAVMAVEHAPKGKRGFWGSIPYVGSPIGQALSTALLLLIALAISDDAFVAWGWRIPFVASIVMVAIGLYIRVKVMETPVFEELKRNREVAKRPVLTLLRTEPRQLLLNTGLHLGITVTFFMNSVFIVSYMTTTLELPRSLALTTVLIANVAYVAIQVAAGAASDRFGRRRVYMAGALWAAAMAFPYFLLINTGSPVLITLALLLLGTSIYVMYGPQPAYFSELFSPNVRFTAFALPVAVATVIGGSTAPMFATALTGWADGRPWGVAGYLAAIGLLTALCAWASRETRDVDLTKDRHARQEEDGTQSGRLEVEPR
ncbi:MAG: MFS transporter [Streptosporangiales bacterium]|nr:MFS transporter [Streptosporangiales bacterium]